MYINEFQYILHFVKMISKPNKSAFDSELDSIIHSKFKNLVKGDVIW